MARISKFCVVCHATQKVRLELQPGDDGHSYRWNAWCMVCNTPAPADGPVLLPAEVQAWVEAYRAKAKAAAEAEA